jgi:predicted nucleotidyltransferase
MNKIMIKLQEHYNTAIKMNLEVVGVFLQGSQNYNLHYENSDIDSKAILLPNFEDFVLCRTPTSTTYEFENKEHLDLKDIRLMFDCFKKQNINFVEILFTPYKIINPRYEELIKPLFDNNEKIARYNNYLAITCMDGMSKEKYKALEHPYPSIVDKIEKYGYDAKQLHHILRLNEFIKRYIKGEKYKDCLISNNREYLIDVKKFIHTLDEARTIAKKTTEETSKIRKEYIENNPVLVDKECETIINNILLNIMKYNFKIQLEVL